MTTVNIYGISLTASQYFFAFIYSIINSPLFVLKNSRMQVEIIEDHLRCTCVLVFSGLGRGNLAPEGSASSVPLMPTGTTIDPVLAAK